MKRLAMGLLAMMAVVNVGVAQAAVAPQQRGAVIGPPAENARAVVTLCGLAVLMVEDSAGQSASLYAGDAIDERLARDAIAFDEYELAEMYMPVAVACESIRAEHERLLKDRAASDPSH